MKDDNEIKFTGEQKKGILKMYEHWLFTQWIGRMLRKLWLAIAATVAAIATMKDYLINLLKG